MLFLLAVVVVAVRYGRGPAVLAAFLSVGAFDFFFVPPRFSFAVSDVQYLLTFGVMLVVALVIGQMTAGLSYQARVAHRARRARARAVRDVARPVGGADGRAGGRDRARVSCAPSSTRDRALVLPDADDQLQRADRRRRAGRHRPRHRAVGLRPRRSRPATAPTRCRPARCCTCR